MSDRKLAGCCSLCDAPAFEILQRWDEGERRAGEPKRLGPPLPGSMRITFLLLNGRVTDMTVCEACAAVVAPEHYATLWGKNLAGYLFEQEGKTEMFKHEFENGILSELARFNWKELVKAHVR